MTERDDLIERLLNYEIDGTGLRREAADEIIRLTKHITIMHDIAGQRDTIIIERGAQLAERDARIGKLVEALEELRTYSECMPDEDYRPACGEPGCCGASLAFRVFADLDRALSTAGAAVEGEAIRSLGEREV